MKIDVGMYVRTSNDGIAKVLETDRDGFKADNNSYYMYDSPCIIKASFVLGELLEVEDFIDYHCISEIKSTTIYTNNGWFIDFDDVEDLVSRILTHEQFESYSYKVGE